VGGSVLGFVVVVDALALAWPSPTGTNGAQVVGCAKGSPFEIRDTMERRRASRGRCTGLFAERQLSL
jgi:hypothetical protein